MSSKRQFSGIAIYFVLGSKKLKVSQMKSSRPTKSWFIPVTEAIFQPCKLLTWGKLSIWAESCPSQSHQTRPTYPQRCPELITICLHLDRMMLLRIVMRDGDTHFPCSFSNRSWRMASIRLQFQLCCNLLQTLAFIPPVTRMMVSLPDRSVTFSCTSFRTLVHWVCVGVCSWARMDLQ